MAGPATKGTNDDDGFLTGLTRQSISAKTKTGEFSQGVDYLGYWLMQAKLKWKNDHPGVPLESVDVVAHSTGGLVTRSYIQSSAYPTNREERRELPAIGKFVMLAVPNQGAPKALSLAYDDWWLDLPDPTYPVIFRAVVHQAFKKVLNGERINGGDHIIALAHQPSDGAGNYKYLLADEDANVTAEEFKSEYRRSSLLFTKESELVRRVRRRFIDAYIAQIRGLIATYNFVETDGDKNGPVTNYLLQDLNAGGVDQFTTTDLVDTVFNLFGNEQETTVGQREKTGRFFFGDGLVQHFDQPACPCFPESGETWFQPVEEDKGDGTVPRVSMTGPLLSNRNVINREYFPHTSTPNPDLPGQHVNIQGSLTHTGFLSNPKVVQDVVESLGYTIHEDDIHDGSRTIPSLSSIIALANDPVRGMLVDGQGRRLGLTADDQVVSEIPGGIYFGGQDGIGYLITNDPDLKLHLTGVDGEYFVEVAHQNGEHKTGVSLDGNLGNGQELIVDLPGLVIQGVEALPESTTIVENTSADIPILANDRSAEAALDLATVVIQASPKFGVVQINRETGVATYMPNINYVGTDSFTYTVADADGNTGNEAAVTIEVIEDSNSTSPWQNQANPLNVDNDPDNIVSPIDALIVINELNAVGSHALPPSGPPSDSGPYLDVDGDNFVAPLDALLVINFLNDRASAVSEGEQGAMLPALVRPDNIVLNAPGVSVGSPQSSTRHSNRSLWTSPLPKLRNKLDTPDGVGVTGSAADPGQLLLNGVSARSLAFFGLSHLMHDDSESEGLTDLLARDIAEVSYALARHA